MDEQIPGSHKKYTDNCRDGRECDATWSVTGTVTSPAFSLGALEKANSQRTKNLK